jgi:inosine/xanthosine triphosphate pyrophosphatase family protein
MTKAIDRSAYFECVIAWAYIEKVIFFSGKLHTTLVLKKKEIMDSDMIQSSSQLDTI